MKKITLLALSIIFMSTSSAFAGGACCYGCNSDAYIEKKMEKLEKQLDLEANQLPQVEAILRTKMESKQAAKDRMKQEMNAVSETFQNNMNQVLNADQQNSLQKMMDKYNEKKKCKKKKRFFIF